MYILHVHPYLEDRNAINFDLGAQGQGRSLDTGSRGHNFVILEVIGVDFVYLGKVGQIGEKYGTANDIFGRSTGLFQDGIHIFQDLLGFFLDVAPTDNFSGTRIEGDIPRAIDSVSCCDSLAVGADGSRGITGFDFGEFCR